MDEKPDQIMNHIESQRDELGRHINELESRVKRSVDWRAQFDRNPMLMMGVAMGGGLLLGAIVNGRSRGDHSWSSSTRNRGLSSGSGYATSSADYSTAASTLSSPSPASTREYRRKATDTVEQLKAALIGFATAKAKEFMSEALPGFSHHLDEAGRRPRKDQFAQSDVPGQMGYQAGSYQGGATRADQPFSSPYRQEPS